MVNNREGIYYLIMFNQKLKNNLKNRKSIYEKKNLYL